MDAMDYIHEDAVRDTATAVIEYGGYEYYRYRLTGGAVP